ncbi:homocitrate synthase, partial [Candidatus Omnitrophota bacterium]
MTNKPKIYIVDVTNRDGVQTSRICLSKLQKTMINYFLDKMGIFQSEFGFPLTRHETSYLNANLELAKKKVFNTLRLGGWVRATASDVQAACKLVPKLEHMNLSISTSDQMINHKFKGKLDHAGVIKEMVGAVKKAKKLGAKSIGVNAEDASRSRMEYLIEFAAAAKEAGADRIRYCDTLGCDSPFTIYERIKQIAQEVEIPLEIHCHNDLGLVIANSVSGAMAANDAGVDAYINTCVNGMGERAGNADLISVILAIKCASGIKDVYKLGETINLKVAWKM